MRLFLSNHKRKIPFILVRSCILFFTEQSAVNIHRGEIGITDRNECTTQFVIKSKTAVTKEQEIGIGNEIVEIVEIDTTTRKLNKIMLYFSVYTALEISQYFSYAK